MLTFKFFPTLCRIHPRHKFLMLIASDFTATDVYRDIIINQKTLEIPYKDHSGGVMDPAPCVAGRGRRKGASAWRKPALGFKMPDEDKALRTLEQM